MHTYRKLIVRTVEEKKKREREERNQQALMGKLAKEIRIQTKCPTLVSQHSFMFSFVSQLKALGGSETSSQFCLLWEQLAMYE